MSRVIASRTACFRARQQEDGAAAADAGGRAREHGRRPDLLEAQHAEQLAEAVEPLLEEGRDRLVGGIALRDARAAGRDDHARVPARDLVAHDAPRPPPARRGPSAARRRVWPACFEQLGDRLAARLGLERARVADREDEARDAATARARGARRPTCRKCIMSGVRHLRFAVLLAFFVAAAPGGTVAPARRRSTSSPPSGSTTRSRR